MESITVTTPESKVTKEDTAHQLAKPVTDLDELLSDSPLSAEDSNNLFDAIMADRRMRRKLTSEKNNR
ncbi:MAG: hypothetical protein P9X24_14285 [Candidatus Hatepunaea meridiana]|nr:hypothetical protein [Candidatus Hatepunaea meridiana]